MIVVDTNVICYSVLSKILSDALARFEAILGHLVVSLRAERSNLPNFGDCHGLTPSQ
jgi:hypothetical protein